MGVQVDPGYGYDDETLDEIATLARLIEVANASDHRLSLAEVDGALTPGSTPPGRGPEAP